MGLTQDFAGSIEPEDPAWERAPSDLKRKYYEAGGKIVLDELKKQLDNSVGRNGRALKPRIQAVLPDGADGPVMEPHEANSRVNTLADYSATDHGLKLWWHAGTGHATHRRARATGEKATPFGEILQYHADGLVPNAPVRDVRLCAARIANVKHRLAPVWSALRAGLPVAPLHINTRAAAGVEPHNPFGERPFTFPIAAKAPEGITDLRGFTFGIGASKAEVQKAIDAGTFTGFRQLPRYNGRQPPPGGLPASVLPPKPKPAPAAAGSGIPSPYKIAAAHKLPPPPHAPAVPGSPSPSRTPGPAWKPAAAGTATATKTRPVYVTRSLVESALGVKFTESPQAQAPSRYGTVLIDLVKLDNALKLNPATYVGRWGSGAAKPGSYEGFGRFLAAAKRSRTAIEMPRVALDARGVPDVIDGRHRIAVFRDQGAMHLPISVPRGQLNAFRAAFGP